MHIFTLLTLISREKKLPGRTWFAKTEHALLQLLETVVEFSTSLKDNTDIYLQWVANLGLPNISTHWKQARHYREERNLLLSSVNSEPPNLLCSMCSFK